MDRRAFLFACSAVPMMLVAQARAAEDVRVIYVGGWDCQPCTTWKNRYKADWLASPDFHKVRWIEVEAPKLKEAYQDRYWPGDLKSVLDQLPRKSGTPRFLVVRSGTVVFNEFGVSKWTHALAEIHKLVG